MKKLYIRISFLIFLYFPSGYTFAQQLSFGIVTDIHFAEIPKSGTRRYTQSLDKLKECTAIMNEQKVDFLVELGDFKDMSQPPDEQKTLGFLKQVEEVFCSFDGPRYHVLGNHDEDCISKEEFLSICGNSGIDTKKSYYSYNSGGFHFVVLDANYDSAGQDFDHGHYNWGDPNIPEKEMKWLEDDLKESNESVIIFIHQLLDGAASYQVKNAAQVRAVLENSGKVKCVFQGHYHEGNYSENNGIPYYTLRSLVRGRYPWGSSYAIVTVSAETIKIRGFRKAKSLTLESGISTK
ncbi:MAG: metallophosphoesterase family protein [Bacteroidota bacterium]